MSLIIEDGSIVANANSFVTLSELASYVEARAITLYAEDGTTELTDAQKEALLINAYDYFNNIDAQLSGDRVSKDQTGAYPRYNLWIDGFSYSSDEIPSVVKTTQMALVVEAADGSDAYAATGTIESESFNVGNGAVSESFTYLGGKVAEIKQSDLLIRRLKPNNGGGASITVFR